MSDAAETDGATALASALRVFVDALRELGADWEGILRACEIDPAALLDPEARIPRANFDQVWVTAAERTGDPCIGLHAGERIHPRAVNVFGYLALSSSTLGEGLARIARYQALLAGRHWLRVTEEDGVARVGLAIEEPHGELQAIRAEYTSMLVLAFLAWVADRAVLALEVDFAHPPRGPVDDYARAL